MSTTQTKAASMLARLRTIPFEVVLIALLFIAVSFLLKGRIGLNLADEGFLWYGTQHTALGEVPLRDFQSYDPGRYYWGALWFKILRDNGIISLRLGEAALQFFGLCFGLMTLRGRVFSRWWTLAAAGFVLWKWMAVYESVVIMSAIYFAVLLIERPSLRRHFAAGVTVGLAAFFGRNYGLYCASAFGALILFVWLKIDRTKLSSRTGVWLLGVLVGYLPMIAMIAFIPGFLHALIESVWFNLTVATRLPLPVPWPWRQNYSLMTWDEAAQAFGFGLLYVLVPLSYLVAAIHLVMARNNLRRKAILIGCAFVGVAFLDYTFSRASIGYLVMTMEPVVIGLLALPVAFGPRHRKVLMISVWALILIGSRVTLWGVEGQGWYFKAPIHAHAFKSYQGSYDLAYRDYGYVRTRIAGDDLWLPAEQAKAINDIKQMVQERVGPDENILIAPYWTTFYPILGKKSPVWEIYFLFPQPQRKQEEMIGDLKAKNVNWVIVCDVPLDGRDDLRFSNTHNYVWRYLMDNFEPVKVDVLYSPCQLLQRKQASLKL